MRFFMNDYGMGAHPAVLDALAKANDGLYSGYGTDGHSRRAAGLIRGLCAADGADVHFLMGGTQTNLAAIAAFLRPHEAVIAPASGHINVHETGAIEAAGHKILAAAPDGGKLGPEQVRSLYVSCTDEHMVKPRLVFISQPTECGTMYSLAELRSLRGVCDELGLLLYIDGARLAVALTAEANDASLPDIAGLADAFYIGGTKNGLMFGEVLVIVNEALKADFRYIMKQRGAMMAKGFLIGLQFCAVLENGLYFEIAAQANRQARKLQGGLARLGVEFAFRSVTNQLFPIFDNSMIAELEAGFDFERWSDAGGGKGVIRFVTTWRTLDGDIYELLARVAELQAARAAGRK
ncbi:MAG: aminotransferase class I/II-fold pyridoxal phosphate-dependent enzyme [Clostridiales Family XIII bacterium]|jgi:threonine aldolase|nr:aminotransferase class I/II-fold pyridoxal phosphate-dependent enzyme [Clostridiales Family XIII bacterium]